MKKHLILLFISLSLHSFSQSDLTLEQAITYGLENSHEIAIIKNDAEIIKNTTHTGAAGVLPNIFISSGYNGAINNVELEINPFLDFGEDMDSEINASQAQSLSMMSSVGLSYRLFNGFSGIYTLKKFKQQRIIADENTRYQIENKILEIIQQYYDVLNKTNIYNTFATTHSISLERYQQSVEKHEIGAISKLNLLNAEANLNQDKVNMEEALLSLKASKLNMSLLIGVPDTKITIAHDFKFNNSLNLDTLLKQTMSNNSSITMATLNYDVAQYELKIAKSSFSPSVDLITSYSYNNMQSETSFISKQTDRGIVAGVNISIPILSSNMRKKAFQNAKINLDSKNRSLEHIEETIKTALVTAYYNYTEGLKNLDLLAKNIETIETTADLNKELYDMGQISNLEYRESQVLLDQTRINYSLKLSSIKIQEFIIYQLSGQLQTK